MCNNYGNKYTVFNSSVLLCISQEFRIVSISYPDVYELHIHNWKFLFVFLLAPVGKVDDSKSRGPQFKSKKYCRLGAI